jgi:uncharacterized membrane protein
LVSAKREQVSIIAVSRSAHNRAVSRLIYNVDKMDRANSLARLIAASVAGFIIVLAVSPALSSGAFSEWVMTGFSGICHQLTHRSPHVSGEQLAACHRCFGVYGGLLLGALIIPLKQDILSEWREYVVPGVALAIAPAGIDWLGGYAGWWTGAPWIRYVTGGIFGLMGGAFILVALRDLVRGPSAVEA